MLGDCFSRLPRMEKQVSVEDELVDKNGKPRGTFIDFKALESPVHENVLDDEAYFIIDEDNEVIECLLNLQELHEMPNPINMKNIFNHQRADQDLMLRHHQNPQQYPINNISGIEIITIRKDGVKKNQWKIACPPLLLPDIVGWYHFTLGHPGTQRLYDTISRRFAAPGLYTLCERFICPVNCHRWKHTGQGYGHLPPRIANTVPWDEVAVDLVGPWTIEAGDCEYAFNALTCIGPVTNLVELIRVDCKTAKHVGQQFENAWLSRYPFPNRCIHDNGGEFIGQCFKAICIKHSIDFVPTTVKNPQSNAICERMHKTILDILRIIMRTTTISNYDDAKQVMDNALATMMHATRCAVNHTMQNSPEEMVFRRDMFIDVQVIADLEAI